MTNAYHAPTQSARQATVPTRLWTPGFLLIFLLFLILTVGGSIVAFNIANPYGPENPAGLDHATEAALTLLALLVSFTTLLRARSMLAGLIFLLNGAAICSLGLVFLQQTLRDMQSSLQLFIQLTPTQISQILLFAPLAAGIGFLLWLPQRHAHWGQRLWLILFGVAICLCALGQTLYTDSTIPKHMVLLSMLIVFIQGLLVAGQIAHQRK